MARFLIQSQTTGRFLAPSLSDGHPEWVVSLREAGGGVLRDLEAVHQIVQEHCDFDDMPQLIDLDRLGTADDYPPTGSPVPLDPIRTGSVLDGARGRDAF